MPNPPASTAIVPFASDDEGLTSQQLTCLDLLVAGQTKTAAATATRVTLRTVLRWCKDPIFVAKPCHLNPPLPLDTPRKM